MRQRQFTAREHPSLTGCIRRTRSSAGCLCRDIPRAMARRSGLSLLSMCKPSIAVAIGRHTGAPFRACRFCRRLVLRLGNARCLNPVRDARSPAPRWAVSALPYHRKSPLRPASPWRHWAGREPEHIRLGQMDLPGRSQIEAGRSRACGTPRVPPQFPRLADKRRARVCHAALSYCRQPPAGCMDFVTVRCRAILLPFSHACGESVFWHRHRPLP
jgi:hypothetical protein